MPVLYFNVITRSEALAKEAAANLQQQYNATSAEIISRRNSAGKFSSRGHHFIVEVRTKKKKRQKEWVIKTSYKARKGGGKGGPGRTLLTDIRVSTPEDWSRDRVQEALLDFIDGKKVKGLRVRAFDWARNKEAHAKPPADIKAMRDLAPVFFSMAPGDFDIKEEEKG